MGSAALRHFVDRALELHAVDLDATFPSSFDWQQLCRDTPVLAQAATDGRFDAEDPFQAEDLVARADRVFRIAHVTALAVLCAEEAEGPDPEQALAHFCEPVEDEEDERFAELAAALLDGLEARLVQGVEGGGSGARLDERAAEAERLYELAWPHVEQAEGLLPPPAMEDDEPDEREEATRVVLIALLRVAVLLAVLRWMAL